MDCEFEFSSLFHSIDVSELSSPASSVNDSFEETYEKVTEEGEAGSISKIVQLDRITLHKSIREYRMSSRTPSEEQLTREDSAYQSQRMPHSRSSSIASLDHLDSRSSVGDSSEWYADYKSHSLQGIASRLEHVRSKTQYDSHIAEMKGNFCIYYIFIKNFFFNFLCCFCYYNYFSR